MRRISWVPRLRVGGPDVRGRGTVAPSPPKATSIMYFWVQGSVTMFTMWNLGSC